MKALAYAIATAIAGLALSLGLQDMANAKPKGEDLTGTYELCALELSDGTTIGSKVDPCADASPKNGIRIRGSVIQNCSLPAETKAGEKYCFEHKAAEFGTTIIYTVKTR